MAMLRKYRLSDSTNAKDIYYIFRPDRSENASFWLFRPELEKR